MSLRSALILIMMFLLNIAGSGQEPAQPTFQPLTALNIRDVQHVYTIDADALEAMGVAEFAPFAVHSFHIDWDRNQIISNRPGTAELDYWEIAPFRKLRSLNLEEVTPLYIQVFEVFNDFVLIAGTDDFLPASRLKGFAYGLSDVQRVLSIPNLLAYSDDLSLIAYADEGSRSDTSVAMDVRVYSTRDRRELGKIPLLTVQTAGFNSDNTRLMILTGENELVEIDLLRLIDPVRTLARFSEDGLVQVQYTGFETVTVIRGDGAFGSVIECWNTRTGEIINSVEYPLSLAQFWHNRTIHLRNIQDESIMILDAPSLEPLVTLSLSQAALSINPEKSLLITAEVSATGATDYRVIDILNDDDLGPIPITLPEMNSDDPYHGFFTLFSATGNGIEVIEATSALSEDEYPIVKLIGYSFWGVPSH
jgi:hypothetical protein